MNIDRKLIASVMTRDVCQVAPGQSAVAALALMRGRHVSSVLVVADGQILGIITERDIVRSMHAKDDLQRRSCADLMQAPVVTVGAATSCLDAYHLMGGRGIRHLAVADEAGHALGIVSEGDVMRNFGVEYYTKFKDVGSVMNTGFAQLPPSALVADALRLMIDQHQSCVLVLDDAGHAVGILTERDIVRLSNDQVPTEQLTLYEAMRSPVISIRPRKPLHTAVRAMEEAGIRRLVVADEKGVACGVLTHHEVARGLEGDYVAYLKDMAGLPASSQGPGAPMVDERLVLANILRGLSGSAALASDREWRVRYASPAVGPLLGLRPEDLVGADLRQVLQSVGWSDAAATLKEAASAPGGRHQRLRTAAGDIEFHASVLLDEQRDTRGYLVLARKT